MPLALAFGVTSGLGASAGLYGSIFICFFAALFGGTPTQISGPTAPMTAVSMVVIAGIFADYDGVLERAAPVIAAVFILAGIFQVALGFFGLGKYIRYIPYPVVSGFMTAIGVIILVTQLLPCLGYSPSGDTAYIAQFEDDAKAALIEGMIRDARGEDALTFEDLETVTDQASQISQGDIQHEARMLAKKEASGVMGALRLLPRAVKAVNYIELLIALATILAVFGFRKLTRRVPSTLVALLLVSVIAWLLPIEYRKIEAIPEGFPKMITGVQDQMHLILQPSVLFTALTLSILASIDSLLTSVVADNMTKTRHKPNRELIGQGVGNTFSGLFGGLPGAGATIRTVVNIQAGGKTRLSGIIAALVLLVILLLLSPVASQIPAAVLAGILITVGIGVIDTKGIRMIPNLPRDVRLGPFKLSSEMLIMLVVLVLAVFWNLIYAVGIGLVIASLMFMRSIGELTSRRSIVQVLRESTLPKDTELPVSLREEVFVKHVSGPLFFGSTGSFKQLPQQIPVTTQAVVLRLDRMSYIDQSGLYAMEEVLTELRNMQVDVLLVGLNDQPRVLLEGIEVIPGLVPEDQIFTKFREALGWVRIHVSDRYGPGTV